ncbi:MAG TPA: polynucleotide adenylyltransferase PcnB [Kiritimatiellia bacterium]|nr:polynucleotide adenylyltransferase PcnB [Kiritimatiellia bacterium]
MAESIDELTDLPPPVILTADEHPLREEHIPREIQRVLDQLCSSGYKGYIAGGGIRDLLIGRRPKDFDVVTDARPEQVRRLFRNSRLVGRRFRLAHVMTPAGFIEVSTFRAGVEETPQGNRFVARSDSGVILRDNKYGSPVEDAFRRDFTINALFLDSRTYELIDYVGGLKDIEARMVRSIGEPVQRIREDPVRMIRAVRFAASCGFSLEPGLRRAVVQEKDHLGEASAARMYEEVKKLFLCGNATRVFALLIETGLLTPMFPELAEALESDSVQHRWLERVMKQLDRWREHGVEVSADLLVSLLFAKVHERLAAYHMEHGLAAYPAMEMAVTEHLVRLGKHVFVPRAVIHHVAQLMAMQTRFHSFKSKNIKAMTRRPCFRDAFIYFKLNARFEGINEEAVAWWEQNLGS